MDNQHRKISGYRELTQAEIDLMNKIKALGPQIEAVLVEVANHVTAQWSVAWQAEDERERLQMAGPDYWLGQARGDLQVGLMKLTRAVAQPTTF